MAYDFAGDWAAEIAEVSGDEEYQRCRIQIRNPDLRARVGDIEAGYHWEGDPVIWVGQARIVGVRAAMDILAGNAADPSGSKTVRVQIPYEIMEGLTGRIRRGWQIRVLDGGRNPKLKHYVLTIESDFNSGNVASPVLECSIALDNDPNWSD